MQLTPENAKVGLRVKCIDPTFSLRMNKVYMIKDISKMRKTIQLDIVSEQYWNMNKFVIVKTIANCSCELVGGTVA